MNKLRIVLGLLLLVSINSLGYAWNATPPGLPEISIPEDEAPFSYPEITFTSEELGPSPSNVTNGSLEAHSGNDFTGWTKTESGGSCISADAGAYDGDICAKVVVDAAGSSVSLKQYSIPVLPDTTYELSFYIKGEQSGNFMSWNMCDHNATKWYDASTKSWITNSYYANREPLPLSWKKRSYVFRTLSSGTRIKLLQLNRNSYDCIWQIDDIQIRHVYDRYPSSWGIIDLSGDWKLKKLPGTEGNPADDEGMVLGYWQQNDETLAAAARITWNTTIPSTSQVEYGLDTNYGSLSALDSSLVKSHKVILTGLSTDTVYHYRTISVDANGNEIKSGDQTFSLTQNLSVTNVSFLSSSSGKINWNTAIPSASQVEYGLDTNYGSITPLEEELLPSHQAIITGLLYDTLYHYRVKSVDGSGQETTSNDMTFTIRQQISNKRSTGLGPDKVKVEWNTAIPSTSQVEYGPDINYGNETLIYEDLVNYHSVIVAGLEQGVTYYYQVRSKDEEGRETISDDPTFSTTLAILNVTASSIGANSASIKWNTAIPSTSQVEYGLDTNYGNITTLDGNLVAAHTVSLPNLTSETIYHYRVRSKDGNGAEIISDDYTFTTKGFEISSVSANLNSLTEAVITWKTTLGSTSQLEYGLDTSYGNLTTLDTNSVTSHQVILSGLSSNTTYHYRVRSKNPSTGIEIISGDYAFTTQQGVANIGYTITPTGWTDFTWTDFPVPYNWDQEVGKWEESQQGNFDGVGWYRKKVIVPAEYSSSRIILAFEALDWEARVWVNGVEIGTHTGANMPFEFDITGNLIFGEENTIAVRVFDDSHGLASGETSWLFKGGIYRAVKLIAKPNIYSKRVLITPHLDTTSMELDCVLINPSDSDQTITLNALVTPETQTGSSTTHSLGDITLAPGENSLNFTFPVSEITSNTCWSFENPFLYSLQLEDGNGRVFSRDRFGFREFKAEGKNFKLNGEKVFVTMFQIHNTYFPCAMWEHDIVDNNEGDFLRKFLLALKKANINTIRTSHGELPARFYDMCDEVGLLIYNEWTYRESLYNVAANTPYITEWVYRDYNHPSSVMWLIGNEFYQDRNGITAALNQYYTLVKGLDKQNRPFEGVSGRQQYPFYSDSCDFYSTHGNFGWFTSDYNHIYNYWVQKTGQLYALYGNKPFLNAEAGVAQYNSPPVDGHMQEIENALSLMPVDKEPYIYWASYAGDGGDALIPWIFFGGMRNYPGHEGRDRIRGVYVKRIIEENRRVENISGYLPFLGNENTPLNYGNRITGEKLLGDNFPFTNPAETPLKDMSILASPAYYAEKRTFNPRLIMAGPFDRNLFSGGTLSNNFIVMNYGLQDLSNLKLRVVIYDSAQNALSDQTEDIPALANGDRITLPYTYTTLSAQAPGEYRIRLYLYDSASQIISDNYYNFFIMNGSDLASSIATLKQIALYDPDANTSPVLNNLSIPYTVISDFNSLASYDVLIIAKDALQKYYTAVSAAGSAISDWISSGGYLLCLEQSYFPDFTSGSSYKAIPWASGMGVCGERCHSNYPEHARHYTFIDLVEPYHYLFSGLTQADFDTWNSFIDPQSGNEWGTIGKAALRPLNENVIAACHNSNKNYNPDSAQMAIAEVPIGTGSYVHSQLEVISRYNQDPVATRYLQNLLAYILHNRLIVEVIKGGAKAENAVVSLTPLEGQSTNIYSGVTGRDGKCHFLLPQPGLYEANCLADGLTASGQINVMANVAVNRITLDNFPNPNLLVNNADLSFTYTAWNTIDLSAVIHNNGVTTLNNIQVGFYLGDPAGGGTLVALKEISSISPYGQAAVSTSYTFPDIFQDYSFYVWVDPQDYILEASEEDNLASITITPEYSSNEGFILNEFQFEYSNSPLEHGWTVNRGNLTTEYDPGKAGRVMRLEEPTGGYLRADSSSVNGLQARYLSFDVRSYNEYTVRVQVIGTDGNTYNLYYKSRDGDMNADPGARYVTFPLGTNKNDGCWHTINRDLGYDMFVAFGVQYANMLHFRIGGYGNVWVDDIWWSNAP